MQKELLNKTNNIGFERSRHTPARILPLVRPPLLDGPRQTVVGVVISILALLGFLAFTSPAFASVGVWTYAGQNYPTQDAALAALHAVSPQNALLTQQAGISNANPVTVTYKYAAPTLPMTLGPYSYCPASIPNSPCTDSTYPTVAAAEQAYETYIASVSASYGYCSTQTTSTAPFVFRGYNYFTGTLTAGWSGFFYFNYTYNGPTPPPCTFFSNGNGANLYQYAATSGL